MNLQTVKVDAFFHIKLHAAEGLRKQAAQCGNADEMFYYDGVIKGLMIAKELLDIQDEK